ncbi:uncharacterized protein [Halyomorpha halys]|uniref:uncharacterized protein n=1 Tax=Halyomorpha halys TaxID=286706 RepID=UPI0006D4DBC8|nr:uncharacterized protein LOC106682923 [Halyomorpha halys]
MPNVCVLFLFEDRRPIDDRTLRFLNCFYLLKYFLRMCEWSSEDIMYFLECYQAEPCIWNPQDQDHKDKKKVAEAWSRISEILHKSVKDLKIKKEILMVSFRKHLKKKLESIRSGTDDIYEPIWFAYQLMESFLLPVYTNKSCINIESVLCDSPIREDSIHVKSNISTDCDETSNTQDGEESFNIISEPVIVISNEGSQIKPESHVSCSPLNIPSEPLINKSNERSRLRKTVSKQKGLFKAIEELKELNKVINKDKSADVSSSNHSENQFDIFGRSVATQLKLIPLDKALMAQSQIQEILSQHAIDYYRENNSRNSQNF